MNIPPLELSEPKEQRISRSIPPNYSSWQTIEHSHTCAAFVIANNIPGVLVETGIAAGNNFAAMCSAGGEGHGFDSFEGIPWAGEKDREQPGIGEKDQSKYGVLETSGVSSHSISQVRRNMEKWHIENYTLHAGWFQDTVPLWKGDIAVLRMDGDLFESTLVCLEHLYPKLSVGGVLIIDDWALPGCRLACRHYFSSHRGGDRHAWPRLVFENGPAYFQRLSQW